MCRSVPQMVVSVMRITASPTPARGRSTSSRRMSFTPWKTVARIVAMRYLSELPSPQCEVADSANFSSIATDAKDVIKIFNVGHLPVNEQVGSSSGYFDFRVRGCWLSGFLGAIAEPIAAFPSERIRRLASAGFFPDCFLAIDIGILPMDPRAVWFCYPHKSDVPGSGQNSSRLVHICPRLIHRRRS